jgi:hypothetical protein
MSSLGELLAAGLVMVLQIVELFVLLVVLDRLGFQPASLEADTWHGRPVSQADHDPEGPHFGFVLFMLGIFVLLAFNIFAVDALLSLV